MNEYRMRWEQEHRLREAAHKQRQQELLRAIPKSPQRKWIWVSKLVQYLRTISRQPTKRISPLPSRAEKAF